MLLKRDENAKKLIQSWSQNVAFDPDVVFTVVVRLLHAVPEQREEEEPSVLQQELISGLADVYQTSRGPDDKRAKKREKASSHFFMHIPEF